LAVQVRAVFRVLKRELHPAFQLMISLLPRLLLLPPPPGWAWVYCLLMQVIAGLAQLEQRAPGQRDLRCLTSFWLAGT
jgi:hypothetical protein